MLVLDAGALCALATARRTCAKVNWDKDANVSKPLELCMIDACKLCKLTDQDHTLLGLLGALQAVRQLPHQVLSADLSKDSIEA